MSEHGKICSPHRPPRSRGTSKGKRPGQFRLSRDKILAWSHSPHEMQLATSSAPRRFLNCSASPPRLLYSAAFPFRLLSGCLWSRDVRVQFLLFSPSTASNYQHFKHHRFNVVELSSTMVCDIYTGLMFIAPRTDSCQASAAVQTSPGSDILEV